MAQSVAIIRLIELRRARRTSTSMSLLLLLCGVFVLFGGPSHGSPAAAASTHGGQHRLVCWQAIMKCHGEAECHYAYDQYLYACAPVLSGDRDRESHRRIKCPSHCISSLIQLNLTQSGPSLETCDCAQDPACRATKRAIEPCLPRLTTTGGGGVGGVAGPPGCTEARRQCERDPPCSAALRDYLFHCRKLFGGESCSDECRWVIHNMRSVPKARQLDTCVCDGTERNICEYIKVSMKNFCFDSSRGDAGSGGLLFDSEEDSEDDYFEQPEDRTGGGRRAYVDSSSGAASSLLRPAGCRPGGAVLTVVVVATILVLLG